MSKKRQQIAAAAERVLYREGFAQVGVDRIVDEADVALGTLYKHFPGKEDVIVAALAHREETFLERMEEPEGEGGIDAVLRLFDRLLDWGDEKGGNGCLFLRAAADYPEPGPVREAAVAHKQTYLALIERRLRHAGWEKAESKRLALRIFVLLEGAVSAVFALGRETAIAEAKETARLLLLACPPRG